MKMNLQTHPCLRKLNDFKGFEWLSIELLLNDFCVTDLSCFLPIGILFVQELFAKSANRYAFLEMNIALFT